ncbi:MAG: CopD family protein [Halobaculum sp.]
MGILTTAAYAIHGIAAGIWIGAVVLVSWRVVPLATDGALEPATLESVADGLSWITRTNALLMPATGLWMAWTVYDQFAGLLVPPRGHTVLLMVVLWLVMTGLAEIGAARIREAAADGKVRTAGRESRRALQAASVVGVVLLGLGGYLVGPPL